jgi:hypothetical protein
MHVNNSLRVLTGALVLLGWALAGCSHNSDTPSAPPVQPRSNQVSKTLVPGTQPPPTSPALDAAKQRFGHQ